MPAPYVTGEQILQMVAGSNAPSADADDVTWAGICADAIEGAIAHRLGDGGYTPTASQDDRLAAAARIDGAALYVSRKAPHGVLSFGPDGDVARLGAPELRACEPILAVINPPIG